MADQHGAIEQLENARGDLGEGRLGAEKGVAQAIDTGGAGRERAAGVDQLLEGIDSPIAMETGNTHLANTVAISGVETGGFDVEGRKSSN